MSDESARLISASARPHFWVAAHRGKLLNHPQLRTLRRIVRVLITTNIPLSLGTVRTGETPSRPNRAQDGELAAHLVALLGCAVLTNEFRDEPNAAQC